VGREVTPEGSFTYSAAEYGSPGDAGLLSGSSPRQKAFAFATVSMLPFYPHLSPW
jgi:hypothetical protein